MRTAEKIRVVHIIGGFRFGGIEKLVYDLVSEQKRSAAVCPQILVVRDQGEFSHQFMQLNVPITAINPISNYWFDFKRIKKIMSVFNESEIVHFHGFHLILGVLAVLSGKKIIYTEHGNFAFGRKKKIKDRIQHFLRRCFYKWFVDVVACNSKFTKKNLNNCWNFRSNKIMVIYNGSKPAMKNENEVSKIREYYGNKFIIGTISRLAGVKKINRLVHAFRHFSAEIDDTVLVIVGEGPERGIIEKEAGIFLNRKIFLTGI
jgi:glycosyltransferase involved in cell wall biosynthesis